MEYRDDLAKVLLSGLPEGERHHVVEVIYQVDADKLRRKRAHGADVDDDAWETDDAWDTDD